MKERKTLALCLVEIRKKGDNLFVCVTDGCLKRSKAKEKEKVKK